MITLTFDQVIYPASLDTPKITIFKSNFRVNVNQSVSNFTFTPPFNNLLRQPNDTSVVFYMTGDDYAKLLVLGLNGGLASSASTMFMTMKTNTIKNFNGTQSIAIPFANAIPPSTYIPDTAIGYVTRTDIDMNLGVMVLEFSKPVSLTTNHPISNIHS